MIVEASWNKSEDEILPGEGGRKVKKARRPRAEARWETLVFRSHFFIFLPCEGFMMMLTENPFVNSTLSSSPSYCMLVAFPLLLTCVALITPYACLEWFAFGLLSLPNDVFYWGLEGLGLEIDNWLMLLRWAWACDVHRFSVFVRLFGSMRLWHWMVSV